MAPYLYIYYQKIKIKKQVNEMLANGLIWQSKLILKSDSIGEEKRWNLKVLHHYRALNKASINDRFIISATDDILDELGDSIFFSKLDLRAKYHQIIVHEGNIYKRLSKLIMAILST